jgi:4-amino-4-deoxy-L-arabinose transferase-like glycosyltransferase
MTSILLKPDLEQPASHGGNTEAATDKAGGPADISPAGGSNWRDRLIRGHEGDPKWARPSLFALLFSTGLLYIWSLGASGWANSFYSAAVQAGSVSWKAMFFGSSDAGNSITVDKPPASLWVMEISARIFGMSSWSMLIPQALLGVATVGVIYMSVRRYFGAAAGLIAGAALALTPVATLMFRFNNPDALLVLLMTIAGYTTLRAVESGRTKWLVATGVLIGFGFLTKQLQVLLVVPGFALTYLVVGKPKLGRRVVQLLLAGAAMVAAAGWWIAIVSLWPASSRPYIGGSQHNSILELTLGYNGFGRLTGNETGSVGGGGGGTGMWGATGIGRLFNSEIGGQISWLIPAALILAVGGLVLRARAPRSDGRRASYLVWGSWLVVTGLTFSFMAGIFHAYYTVALAPAIAALVGAGAAALWKHRTNAMAAMFLAAAVAVTALWSHALLARSADFHPWLRTLVLVVGLLAAVGILAARFLPGAVLGAVAAGAVLAGLAGPAAYSLETASTAHTGSIVTAGPTVAGSNGFGGGRGGAGGAPGGAGGGQGGFGGGTRPAGAPGGTGTATGGTGTATGGTATGGTATGGTAAGGQTRGAGGGGGGLLNATSVSSAMVTALKANASDYRWVAATVGANNASGYQLASGEAVMPIGGFNGTDPSPTLAQFQAYVAAGDIHYFISSGLSGNGASTGGSNAAAQIASWVAANFTSTTIGSTTVYDLTTGS